MTTTGTPESEVTTPSGRSLPTASSTPQYPCPASSPTPRFGGQIGGTAWIGGVPKTNFFGVTRTQPESPCCYRPTDPVSQMKSYGRRIEGNATKFKRDDPEYPLLSFANDALSHMQEYGMDTYFYLEGIDPSANPESGKDLFRYHTKYTKQQVDDFINECLGLPTTRTVGIGKLDALGQEALKDSGTWLMNSLDETMRSSPQPVLPPRPMGPTVWMRLVSEVQMESLC